MMEWLDTFRKKWIQAVVSKIYDDKTPAEQELIAQRLEKTLLSYEHIDPDNYRCYLTTNEKRMQHTLDVLATRAPGGLFVGVSFSQCYEFMAAMRATNALLIDVSLEPFCVNQITCQLLRDHASADAFLSAFWRERPYAKWKSDYSSVEQFEQLLWLRDPVKYAMLRTMCIENKIDVQHMNLASLQLLHLLLDRYDGLVSVLYVSNVLEILNRKEQFIFDYIAAVLFHKNPDLCIISAPYCVQNIITRENYVPESNEYVLKYAQ